MSSIAGAAAAVAAALNPRNLLVIEPLVKNKHTASMIILHGLGDSAHGWIDVAEQLADALPHVKFILPSASDKPVTLNGGAEMPSWYDIKNLAGNRALETCDGLDASSAAVRQIIEDENKNGIPYQRIVLGGFSQGGAMSLWTGLQLDFALAGVLSMSGYLPRSAAFKVTEEAKSTPVLFCHGTSDPVVQYSWAQSAHEAVKQAGVKQVNFLSYKNMQHTANQREIQDVYEFVRGVVPEL